ncbi:hypothetical protein [Gulbenkiania mobilis]|uniref:hypothetical protein n=1 Tax=Gulbenkiania mobilis TaxID=397457 RepID=UPI00137914E2|nr:hypothetical protein [Gulbenkiania mobilis]
MQHTAFPQARLGAFLKSLRTDSHYLKPSDWALLVAVLGAPAAVCVWFFAA